jgi:hypothetical protein
MAAFEVTIEDLCGSIPPVIVISAQLPEVTKFDP